MDLAGLQYEQFTELLQELLVPPGAALSRRRVVGVFVVCADLLLRTLEEGQEGVFTPLLQWSTAFIAEHVALWVTRHGGWVRMAHFIYTVTPEIQFYLKQFSSLVYYQTLN